MHSDKHGDSNFKQGITYAFLAYFFWGFFPIYWKLLKHVATFEILSHRVFWAFVFYTLVISIKNKKFILFKSFSKKDTAVLLAASCMLMGNWLLYIYAVNSNHVIESSLGYFITPLANILLGVVFFKEKLSKNQLISTILATIGVLIITSDQGQLPWIALGLAFTFSIYGSLKKVSKVPGAESNQFESFIFFIPALLYIVSHRPEWLDSDKVISTSLLLMGAGVVTGFPLILFAEAAKRIPYYMMGFFQFIAPTLQFLSGYILFHEPLSEMKLIGFIFIWAAILYLIVTSYWSKRRIIKLSL